MYWSHSRKKLLLHNVNEGKMTEVKGVGRPVVHGFMGFGQTSFKLI